MLNTWVIGNFYEIFRQLTDKPEPQAFSPLRQNKRYQWPPSHWALLLRYDPFCHGFFQNDMGPHSTLQVPRNVLEHEKWIQMFPQLHVHPVHFPPADVTIIRCKFYND